MKITLELNPETERDVFDRVMAAVAGTPAPVAHAATPIGDDTSVITTTKEDPDGKSDDVENIPDETPRAYGEAAGDRKRRTKVEIAEDQEIDALAAKTDLAIRTDIPATEMLAELKDELEKAPDGKSDEEEEASDGKSDEEASFDVEEEEEELTPEAFRARVITLNKTHGKAAIAVLSQYGAGLSKIPKGKYGEVLAKLEALDDA